MRLSLATCTADAVLTSTMINWFKENLGFNEYQDCPFLGDKTVRRSKHFVSNQHKVNCPEALKQALKVALEVKEALSDDSSFSHMKDHFLGRHCMCFKTGTFQKKPLALFSLSSSPSS